MEFRILKIEDYLKNVIEFISAVISKSLAMHLVLKKFLGQRIIAIMDHRSPARFHAFRHIQNISHVFNPALEARNIVNKGSQIFVRDIDGVFELFGRNFIESCFPFFHNVHHGILGLLDMHLKLLHYHVVEKAVTLREVLVHVHLVAGEVLFIPCDSLAIPLQLRVLTSREESSPSE